MDTGQVGTETGGESSWRPQARRSAQTAFGAPSEASTEGRVGRSPNCNHTRRKASRGATPEVIRVANSHHKQTL